MGSGGHNSDGYRNRRVTDELREEFLDKMTTLEMTRSELVQLGKSLAITYSQVYHMLSRLIIEKKIKLSRDIRDGRKLLYYKSDQPRVVRL
jgi:hypothetical protein